MESHVARIGTGRATTKPTGCTPPRTLYPRYLRSAPQGRCSFIGAPLGALLIQEIITTTTFLGLGQSWQQWLPGLLILVAAGAYSRARDVRAAALRAEVTET